MSISEPSVSVAELEVQRDRLDPAEAAERYRTHGALVVRGLFADWVKAIGADIELAYQEALELLPQAREVTEGWVTPDGTLWLPAPEGYGRDKQVMVLACGYTRSAAFFRSAFDPAVVELMTAILGPDVELFMNGQCLLKEPTGGHAKHLHQDSAYFEHRFEGPVGVLTYVTDTNLAKGCLHVVPGSHRLGQLEHVDTFSHLGLRAEEWPWERALPVEGKAGDAIFFHVRCVHGSPENHTHSPRPVFIHRYRRADDYVVVSGTTTDNRAEAERRAAEARKENQPGFMVAGFRRHQPLVEG